MFDPEGKPEKIQISGVTYIGKPVVQWDDDRVKSLKHYIHNSSVVREAYGLALEVLDGNKRKLVIKDLEKIKSFDEATKQVLRELLKEEAP